MTQFSSVQSLSRVQLFATPWTAARQTFLFITNSRSLPKLTSMESVMPSNHFILCCPLLLPPSIFPSIRVFPMSQLFASGSQRIGVSARAAAVPMNIQEMISFRMDWLDLLAVQGTLKSPLQHQSSKASTLCHSAFFIVQAPNPCMTTEKTTTLTRQTFAGKVMSLLFITLSSLVITFLPRSKFEYRVVKNP